MNLVVTCAAALVAVMGSAILASWLSYQYVAGWSTIRKPENCLNSPAALPEGTPFCAPTNTQLDAQLLGGAAIFGMGWGLTGVCPGPAWYAAASGVVDVAFVWMPAFLVGSFIGQKIKAWATRKKKAE